MSFDLSVFDDWGKTPVAPEPSPPDNVFRWGTVTSTSPLAVRLDGDTAPLASVPDTLADGLHEGDRVWCQLYRRRVVVLGSANTHTPTRERRVVEVYREVQSSDVHLPLSPMGLLYGGPITSFTVPFDGILTANANLVLLAEGNSASFVRFTLVGDTTVQTPNIFSHTNGKAMTWTRPLTLKKAVKAGESVYYTLEGYYQTAGAGVVSKMMDVAMFVED